MATRRITLAAAAWLAAGAGPAAAAEGGAAALEDAGRASLAALQAMEGIGAALGGAIDGLRRLYEGSAEALADTIREDRDAARARGVAPLPKAVRARLEGLFPPAVLDRARFRVDPAPAAVPGLAAVAFAFGHADAVTLDDVVLFRDAGKAGSAALWAHELVHVEQYARWGVDGFARRYLLDHRGVEREAYDRAVRVVDAR